MTTNSQNAFAAIYCWGGTLDKKLDDDQTKDQWAVWQSAWSSAIEFAAKACEEAYVEKARGSI